MIYFCKKILFSIIIGILVSSLSLFALVGCAVKQSATSSSSNGDTTLDNGVALVVRMGDATQPDNGNGGDSDPQNDPNEGNIGDTDNSGNATQNGADAPNGNSGNTTEENGENGNTSSGNESSGDIGNGGNTSDDPTPDDPQPEALDFSGLEAKLVEVIISIGRNFQVNELLCYLMNQGKLNILVDMARDGGNVINLYSATLGDTVDFNTQEGISIFTNSFTKANLDKTSSGSTKTDISFVKATSDITVDGVTYSKDGIEGDNPFARQCGVENAWMTYVSDIGKPVLNPNSSTNYFSGYQVLVVFLKDGEIYIRNQPINVECEKGYSEQKILEASLSEEHYVGGELQLSELINLGINLKNPKVAQASDWEWGWSIY